MDNTNTTTKGNKMDKQNLSVSARELLAWRESKVNNLRQCETREWMLRNIAAIIIAGEDTARDFARI